MTYQWAVIGAGPAGIASLGKLLDHGIKAKDIVWIDPAFSVGDFGKRWSNVPSNTRVDLFLKFLQASEAFDFKLDKFAFDILKTDPTQTCQLQLVAEPLQWITNHLRNKIKTLEDFAVNLTMANRTWQIQLKNSSVNAKNVILAVGAEPKTLPITDLPFISLNEAMDKDRIKNQCGHEDTVAVFGSSHSAILVLQNLLAHSVKKIINFYRSQLVYAIYRDNEILFDDTGLKGPTAEWARANLHNTLPEKLIRVYSNKNNIKHYLADCTKVIYAIGFERRLLPTITGEDQLNYMAHTGIIAPGLFGVGIAFPEMKTNFLGMTEHRVGIWKFMDYLQRIMPIWLSYPL